MLLGNTLVNIASSAVATSLLVAIAGERGAVYATLLMTALLLIFAEVMPKTVAIAYPGGCRSSWRGSPRSASPSSVPCWRAVEAIVHGVLRLFGVEAAARNPLLAGREELKEPSICCTRRAASAGADRDMVGGLLDLEDLAVADVMVHRTKMAAISADLPPRELVREVLASPYAPACLARRTENIVGVLHAGDLLRALDAAGDPDRLQIDDIVLEAWFVRRRLRCASSCRRSGVKDAFRAGRRRIRRRDGGPVTLEDILEEIVGEISDEHDA